jgi:DNA-binding PadR family transcriptional regulator
MKPKNISRNPCIIKKQYSIFVIYKKHIYNKSMISSELLKGSLKTIVLKLLKENGRMYGYEITRKVEDLTEGKINLTYGALYPVLHKLESDGILITESENFNNRIRIYYSLTPKGDTVVAEKLRELNEFIESLQRIVEPKTGLSYA